MKHLLAFILFPVISMADCEIELSEIKLSIRATLAPLHEKPNSKIEMEEFAKAQSEVSSTLSQVDECQRRHESFERENYDFERWGEKSSTYFSYLLWMQSLCHQRCKTDPLAPV